MPERCRYRDGRGTWVRRTTGKAPGPPTVKAVGSTTTGAGDDAGNACAPSSLTNLSLAARSDERPIRRPSRASSSYNGVWTAKRPETGPGPADSTRIWYRPAAKYARVAWPGSSVTVPSGPGPGHPHRATRDPGEELEEALRVNDDLRGRRVAGAVQGELRQLDIPTPEARENLARADRGADRDVFDVVLGQRLLDPVVVAVPHRPRIIQFVDPQIAAA